MDYDLIRIPRKNLDGNGLWKSCCRKAGMLPFQCADHVMRMAVDDGRVDGISSMNLPAV